MNIITVKTLSDLRHCANGYILLISVIIVGAIATSVAVSLLFFGVAGSKNSISHQQAEKAKALAYSCAEEGLEQIRSNSGFVGSGGMSFNDGICTYTITNTGGDNRLLIASSTVENINERITVTVSALNPAITALWQETP